MSNATLLAKMKRTSAELFSYDLTHSSGVMDEAITTQSAAEVRNAALQEAIYVVGALINSPMPDKLKGKYRDHAIWGAGADNHGAKIKLSIEALMTKEPTQ